MKEDFLQYIWQHKLLKHFDFKDVKGNPIEILDFGQWNTDAGADFQLAKIKIGNIILVGHIELHIKSSDWHKHKHSENTDYQNIILHIVYENDMEITDLETKNIPTLELKSYIDDEILAKYNSLIREKTFVLCENIFDKNAIPPVFSEEGLLRKLEEKSLEIEESLKRFKSNYEAVLFHYLAYAFGLKVNSQIFKQMAESLDFSTINKVRQNLTQLEALLFGTANWLNELQDETMQKWKTEYDFLKAKFRLLDLRFSPKFLRLRPPNFPTIRLSQLASLYHIQPNLFSKIINANKASEIYELFNNVKASKYWDNHFNFGKISPSVSEKTLSKDFINLLIINAILPIKYTYHKYHNENISSEIINFYKEIPKESNTITKKWEDMGVKIKNSLDSQAYIYHYKTFCNEKKCLNCDIGLKILKHSDRI